MGQIEIDDVDEGVILGLTARSIANGRSLEEEIRAVLAKYALLPPEERVALADSIRAMTPKDVKQTDSTEMIRALRDGRHIRD